MLVEFEGVYRNGTVSLNGIQTGGCRYGYTDFTAELSCLSYGAENTLTVVANNSDMPNSRWYTGSGIYRPVWLYVGAAAHIVHEIKTPLAVIQNTAELLQSEDLSPEQLRKVQTILQASRRLSSLITNILKLNKLEKQAIVPQPENYDLCLQLSECALQFERVWEEKEITFEVDLDERVTIQADESLMELVWTNLLSNAFKFTERGGTVSLRQTTEEDAVAVGISDTGCGMSEETQEHIFDKFYQGDTSRSTEGNGLGLALVQRILLLMNCSISVSSVTGEGSVFTVRIPIETEPKES